MADVFPQFTKTWRDTTYSSIDPRKSSLSVQGKSVAITGGARGIGAAIASSFAVAGASNLILIGRSLSSLESTRVTLSTKFPTTKIHIFSADISDTPAISEIFDTVRKTLGPIDILVSNAAYMPDSSPVASADVSEWWKGYTVNVLGGLNLVQAFLRNSTKEPIIVNITTLLTMIPPIPGASSYGSSKEGFLRVMDFVAAENPHVKVFNIHPGIIDTDMHQKSGSQGAAPLDHG
jgi:NAD(P)-dependent dehydrogenase (short-subunit alcohol dehydrogenase family)